MLLHKAARMTLVVIRTVMTKEVKVSPMGKIRISVITKTLVEQMKIHFLMMDNLLTSQTMIYHFNKEKRKRLDDKGVRLRSKMKRRLFSWQVDAEAVVNVVRFVSLQQTELHISTTKM